MTAEGALLLAAGAGFVGGTMNALAGGGTFATLPALIAIGLNANAANATSNVALLPGAATSGWAFRDEIAPVGGVSPWLLGGVTFAGALGGSVLLVVTPSSVFDVIIPWLLLFASLVLAFGRRAAGWLHDRVTIGTRTLVAVQGVLGVYGGYFGGGLGLVTTAIYGLLAGIDPRGMFALRTLMLAIANSAAALVFVATGLIDWRTGLPMLAGSIIGGWVGAHVGKRLPAGGVRAWTLLVSTATTIVFFWRAYG
ncbi:MAG TPA: sulfite exporter TauE/SafE family protein [Sphingomonas sp.]|nr:sulfite exporter TauE/SafE family protein [Sphingomonas sp.]